MHRPTLSIIVTTYNSPQYLELSVRSIFRQSVLPDEILIADDGSGESTGKLVESVAGESEVPLRHIWQEDEGFRAGAIRNKAIAAASSEYILQIDGDMILHPRFIEDHLSVARRGTFVTGSRVLLSEELSREIINDRRIDISLKEKGVRHPFNGRRIPWLIPFFTGYKSSDGTYTRSCNLACWREDLLKVNGYNEDISGWGREDSELSLRLINAGVKKRFLKFGGIQFHLHHKENSKDRDPRNIAIMENTAKQKLKWIPNGIVKK